MARAGNAGKCCILDIHLGQCVGGYEGTGGGPHFFLPPGAAELDDKREFDRWSGYPSSSERDKYCRSLGLAATCGND